MTTAPTARSSSRARASWARSSAVTTQDEVFVTANAAKAGVKLTNASNTDPLVLLKHFGPRPQQPAPAAGGR